jgi:hypothetical protein
MSVVYREEILYFEDPVFTLFDTTYLITMEGSHRRSSYLRMLNIHRPTRRVIIVHNPGFSSNQKPKWVRNSTNDLWHANQYVLQRAIDNGEDYCFIVEDDFEFIPTYATYVPHIESFLSSRNMNTPHNTIYNLGCAPILNSVWQTTKSESDGTSFSHYRVFSAGFAHSVIYSRLACRHLLTHCAVFDGLHDMMIHRECSVFTSQIPICIQELNENTNNRKNWPVLSSTLLRLIYLLLGSDSYGVFRLFHNSLWIGGLSSVCLVLFILFSYSIRRIHNRICYTTR